MAHLNFNDSTALFSLVGTWIGTVCTLLGLLAVITQLRSLLQKISGDRKEWLRTAVGDWAICLRDLSPSDIGVVEQRAPSLAAWIGHNYIHNQDIVVSPYERETKSGQASWTKLFARLQIQPQDLVDLGGPHIDHQTTERKHFDDWIDTTQSDLLIDGSKISLGLTGSEFAALLILSGFSPSKFSVNGSSSTGSHLGRMYVASHGPFSQVAQMDHSSRVLSEIHDPNKLGRWTHQLNIRNCINIAIGILRFEICGQIYVLVHSDEAVSAGKSLTLTRGGFIEPHAARLLVVRRNLLSLTGISVLNPLCDLSQVQKLDFCTLFQENRWQYKLNSVPEYILRDAVALAAVHPWGLLAIIPEDLAQSLCEVINLGFFGRQSKREPEYANPSMLTVVFDELPKDAAFDIPGWTRASMSEALSALPGRYWMTHNFSGLISRMALYYDAMQYVFQQRNISIRAVEIGFAAHCAYGLAEDIALLKESGQGSFEKAMRERLNGSIIDGQEPWVYEVWGTYMLAWLKESRHLDEDFRYCFRRRVFLG